MSETESGAEASMDCDPISEDALAKKLPKRRIGFVPLLATGAVCILALGAVVYFLWTSAAEDRLAASIVQLSAAGFPTSIAELEATYLPPAEGPPPQALFLTAGENLHKDINTFYKYYGSKNDPAPPGKEWIELAAAKAYLDSVSDEIQALHRDAMIEVVPRYDIKPGVPQSGPVSSILPYHPGHQLSVRHMMLNAYVHAHEGDHVAILQCFNTAFRIVYSVRDEPKLFSHLDAIRNLDQITMEFPKFIHLDYSDDQLEQLQLTIRAFDLLHSFIRAHEGRVVAGIEMCQNPGMWGGSSAYPMHERTALIFETILPIVTSKNRSWSQLRALGKRANVICEQLKTKPIQNARYSVAIQSIESEMPIIDAFARGAANLAVTDALIAAKRYHMKHDKLPSSLTDLVPEFLPVAPVDPFSDTDQPIQLTSSGQTTIYSLSVNGDDDGGSDDPIGKYNVPLDIVVEFSPQ